MTVGTKSLLFGVHQFLIHPFFMLVSWTKLYGFPWDLRFWVAFLVHDWGYWGCSNMDGDEGERHVELGAKIMHLLFDGKCMHGGPFCPLNPSRRYWAMHNARVRTDEWYKFTLYHSRFYAKQDEHAFSRLCVCDKQVIVATPRWIYLPMALLSGEAYEYMERSRPDGKYGSERQYSADVSTWYLRMTTYVKQWVTENKGKAYDN